MKDTVENLFIKLTRRWAEILPTLLDGLCEDH